MNLKKMNQNDFIDIREIGKTSKHIKYIMYKDETLVLMFSKDITFTFSNFSEEQWNKVLSYDDLDKCLSEYLSQLIDDDNMTIEIDENYF